ncbi:MAG: zinc ribbon domain-containing protein [Eubacteriaceae bacterium]
MKSIKPGRGPSMMGALGSVAAAIFGVFWTIGAASMGAPGFFVAFGFVFVLLGIVQAVYNFKNATGENRFSEFDITDGTEEPDPLNEFFSKEGYTADSRDNTNGSKTTMSQMDLGEKIFCPYCGAEAEKDFTYCTKCGKKLPQ